GLNRHRRLQVVVRLLLRARRRDDGYHLLDSLIVFADVGDRLRITPATETTLRVTGPLSQGVPADESNLVIQAANLIGATVEVELEKHLPNAAGIGGGSSDAGATLRVLRDMTVTPVPDNGLSLGADVPVCIHAKAARMRGIGEHIKPLDHLPTLDAVLVNPMVAVPTGPVFRNLETPNNPPMPDTVPIDLDAPAFANWLGQMRNDLQTPAIAVEPAVTHTLNALNATQGCLLARMSGSGATCFGLYPDATTAKDAAVQLQSNYSDWWIRATRLS
ncbi:MAG: 4-(cytidine 5'-diphospho)-2-C-methyl-D-erythritol kinase, partial [Pseudomonadota bacterium]